MNFWLARYIGLLLKFTILVFSVKAYGHFGYNVDLSGLNKDSQTSVRNFFAEAEDLIPTSMKKSFLKPVEVQFRSMDQYAHGTGGWNRITLNKNFIPHILKGKFQSAPSLDPEGRITQHKTMYQLALATVLHETAHLYDFLNIQDRDSRGKISWCEDARIFETTDKELPEICRAYGRTKTSVSTHPHYLERVGWFQTQNGQGNRIDENSFKYRSPDRYELRNPQEHFAVNFEFFLLDPQFKCRRPTLYKFFSSYFKHTPFLNPDCKVNTHYTVPSAESLSTLIREIPLDRIYEIHYLHAGPGPDMISRWGHSMFRLVICAPERKNKGPECLADLNDHIVVSFRAFVDTPQVSMMAGLKGDYDSRLFFIPFRSVVDEYTKTELRDLKSAPIKMTDAQKAEFVLRALEAHWTYSSRYYFLSNNCAVESFNLLKSVLPHPELLGRSITTPIELWDMLARSKLIDPGLFKDRSEAISRGYFFDSYLDRYLTAHGHLIGAKSSKENLLSFVKLPFDRRTESYDQFLVKSKLLPIQRWAVIYLLEDASLRGRKITMTEALLKLMDKSSHDTRLQEDIEDLKKVHARSVKGFNRFSAPFQLLRMDQYGLPTNDEIQEVRDLVEDSAKDIAQDMNKIQELSEGLMDPELRMELKKTTTRLNDTYKMMTSAR